MSPSACFDIADLPTPGPEAALLGALSRTRDELRGEVGRIAAWLVDLPVGAVVVCATADDAVTIAVFFACLRRGLCFLPLDPASTTEEATALIRAAAPAKVLLDPEPATRWGVAGAVRNQGAPSLWSRLFSRASDTFPGCLPKEGAPRREVAADSVVLLLGTSGTTGAPRLVQLTLGNLTAQLRTLSDQLEVERAVVLSLLPLFHYDGLVMGALLAFGVGAPLVRIERFAVSRLGHVGDAIHRFAPTHVVAVPTMLALLLNQGTPAELAGPRLWISTAGPLRDALWEGFEREVGTRVVNVYGLTECGNLCFAGPDDASHQFGTVGRLRDCEVQVVGADDTGELWIRGPSVSPGYLGEPPTGEWLHTGDRVWRRPDGCLVIQGRDKRVVIVGGQNVSPEEVEAVLLGAAGVQDAAVVGVEDPVFGERLIAWVVGEYLDADLQRELGERLSPYKIPRTVLRVAEIPRGASGKVLLPALQALPTDPSLAIEPTVLTLAARAFRVPVAALEPTTTPATCGGWDSQAHVELVAALEAQFDIRLGPTDMMAMESLRAVVEVVRARVG